MSYVILSNIGREFVEVPLFTKLIDFHGSHDLLRSIQEMILENLEIGKTIAGTGGIKKFRMPDLKRQKGKRGGLRVIYLDLPSQKKTYLIYLYDKDEAEDLTVSEKRELKELAAILKGEIK